MMNIPAASAIWELVHINMIGFSGFKSLIWRFCGPSQMVMTLSCYCHVALLHLISTGSPLPTRVPHENVEDFWSHVPSSMSSNCQCFSICLLYCTLWCAFSLVMLLSGFFCLGAMISWEFFNDDLVLKAYLSTISLLLADSTEHSCIAFWQWHGCRSLLQPVKTEKKKKMVGGV